MVQTIEHLVQATHDYEMPEEGFLSLKAGDVLYVIEEDVSGWWIGHNTRNEKGVFPSTYTIPYTCPTPDKTLFQELFTIRRALQFQVDLSSGTPVMKAGAVPVWMSTVSSPPQPFQTNDELYSAVDASMVNREAARAKVLASLRALAEAELQHDDGSTRLSPFSSEDTRRDEVRDIQAMKADMEDKKLQLKKLEQSLSETLSEIAFAKKKLVSDGHLPSDGWYRRVGALVDVVADSSEDVAQRPCLSLMSPHGASLEQLKDLKRVVAHKEAHLQSLSTTVKRTEQEFTAAKEVLTRRIAVRDRMVSTLLQKWAERAERARDAYRRAKADQQCLEAAAEAEERQLMAIIENGKSKYAALIDALHEERVRVKDLKRFLQRSTEIAEIDARIQSVNNELQRHEKLVGSA